MYVQSKSYDQQPHILLSRVLCPPVPGNQRKRNFYRVGLQPARPLVCTKNKSENYLCLYFYIFFMVLEEARTTNHHGAASKIYHTCDFEKNIFALLLPENGLLHVVLP
jgi:hypothetical protein